MRVVTGERVVTVGVRLEQGRRDLTIEDLAKAIVKENMPASRRGATAGLERVLCRFMAVEEPRIHARVLRDGHRLLVSVSYAYPRGRSRAPWYFSRRRAAGST